jgi:hypothetical protein
VNNLGQPHEYAGQRWQALRPFQQGKGVAWHSPFVLIQVRDLDRKEIQYRRQERPAEYCRGYKLASGYR